MRITSWVHISRGIRNEDNGKDPGWQAGWDGESPGLNCVPPGQWLPQWSLASFVRGCWTCESSRSPPSVILSQSIDLSLTASTLFFPVLFLVLSRSIQLTSRCNPSSRFFFFWKAFHFASILNYHLTCYFPIDLPAMMVVISALVILVATSPIDNWALEMWPVWLRNWTLNSI